MMPYARSVLASGSTSRPFTRMLGEPRNPIFCAIAGSLTFTSRIAAQRPSSASTCRTRSRAGLWFGHPSKYKTSIFMFCFSSRGSCNLLQYRTAVLVTFRRHLQLPLALSEGSLQAQFQAPQLCDFLLHCGQLLIQQFLHMRTRRHVVRSQDQELANLIQGESQFLSFADELQSLNVAGTEQTETTLGSR